MDEDLAATVKRLELNELARTCLDSYCTALDTGDLAALRRTLADEVRLELPGGTVIESSVSVVAALDQALAEKPANRKHFHTNAVIRPAGEGAVEGNSYWFAVEGDEGDGFLIAWGRFTFDSRRCGDGVLMTRLSLVIDQAPAPVRFATN